MEIETTKRSTSESDFSNIQIKELLSKDDYDSYLYLKKTFSSDVCRNCRNRRVQSFSEILSAIHCFIEKTKEDSWKRALVCGLCWYKNYLCVNIKQMSSLLEKCKSSINGSLQRLYLIALRNKQQSIKIIIEAIPYLKSHQNLLKMWSVRQYSRPSQIRFPCATTNYGQNFRFNSFQSKNQNLLNILPTQSGLRQYKRPSIKYSKKLNDNKDIKKHQKPKMDEKNSNALDAFNLFKEIDPSEGVFD